MKVPAMFLFIFAVLLTALPAAAAPMLLSIDMYGRNYSIDGVSGGGEEWLNMTFNAFYDSDDVITTYLDEYGTYEQTVTVHDWEFFWLDEQVAEGHAAGVWHTAGAEAHPNMSVDATDFHLWFEMQSLGELDLTTPSAGGRIGDDFDLDAHTLMGQLQVLEPGNGGVSVSFMSVPEPATMFLLGTGLLGLVATGRRKFFKK